MVGCRAREVLRQGVLSQGVVFPPTIVATCAYEYSCIHRWRHTSCWRSYRDLMGFWQAVTATQWYLLGRKHFTATGWERAQRSSAYRSQLETVDLSGKTYMVTGANSGIGREVAETIATRGGNVIMVCRDRTRGEQAQQSIVERVSGAGSVQLLIGDCGLQADVRRVIKEFSERESHLDGLVCNAGTLMHERELTAEGVEVTFATHLLNGVYLLSTLALPLLQKSSDPRVVFVSSGGMYTTKFPHWDTAAATDAQAKFDGTLAYAYAKRGQVLLAEEMAKAHPQVKFVSCHPGWCDTPGVRDKLAGSLSYLAPLRTLAQGADGIAWLCAADGRQLQSGGFYLDGQPRIKHVAGAFMTEGTWTKNSPQEVTELMRRLRESAQP